MSIADRGADRNPCPPRYAVRMPRFTAAAMVMLASGACSPAQQDGATPSPPVDVAPVSAPPSVTSAQPTSDAKPRRLADDEPLQEGLVDITGMVRPTKGGLDVRGVVFEHAELVGVMVQDERPGEDDLLGCKLRVVVDLEGYHAEPPAPGEPQVQMRSGDGFTARRIHSAEIVEQPVTIEGEVSRSKGLLAVGKHLVTRDDLAWSLRGEDPVGRRVRLRGQPRIYVCPPEAQCLIGGSIPMFDVARAELLD